jgi:hypothetical protein
VGLITFTMLVAVSVACFRSDEQPLVTFSGP